MRRPRSFQWPTAPVLFAASMMVVAAGCLTAFRVAIGARIHVSSSVGR